MRFFLSKASTKQSSESLQTASPSARPMFFVHIPKTAGTSFRKSAERLWGESRLFLDYGKDQATTSEAVINHVYSEDKRVELRNQFDTAQCMLIAGHVRLSKFIGFFDLDSVVTFVRDPVQRVASEFAHFKRHYGYKKSFNEFVTTPHFQNRQSFFLDGADIREFGAVGISERYTESIKIINNNFGWELEPLTLNVGRKSLREEHSITKQQRDLIREHNKKDIELYKQALGLLKASHWQEKPSTGNAAMGRCNLDTKRGKIVGWCCELASESASTVTVEINNEHYATVRADRFRPDIQRQGLKRSGCSGFETSTPELMPGDVIRCIIKETGFELQNSPIVYQPG